MIYERRIRLQSVHFNGSEAYRAMAEANRSEASGDYRIACKKLRQCLEDVHGHNFGIVVRVEGEYQSVKVGENSTGWNYLGMLVDDEELVGVVQQWNNKNLSVLPDFANQRATTETMSLVLVGKLKKKWPHLCFTVFVQETEDITVVHSA